MKRPNFKARQVIATSHGKECVEDTFIFSDGAENKYLLFNADKIPAIIFPFTESGNFVVTRIYRFAAREYVWELPGGQGEHGEIPEATATRELLEETGYIPKSIAKAATGLWFDPASLKATYDVWVAFGCEPGNLVQHKDADELIEVKEFPLDEWCRMLGQPGGVVDSKSIVATYLALTYRRRE